MGTGEMGTVGGGLGTRWDKRGERKGGAMVGDRDKAMELRATGGSPHRPHPDPI